jgi:hypothetical protein
VLALLAGAAPRADGQTLTFDDVTVASLAGVPTGYHGFDWFNVDILNAMSNTFPFAPVTAVSPPNVIFPGGGAPSSFRLATPGTFTLGAIDFMRWAPFGPPAPSTTVTGYLGATPLFQTTVALGPAFTTHVFNWQGIDSVSFVQAQSLGGVFVADNLVIGAVASTTPEPSTWAMVAGGTMVLAAGAAYRRRAGRGP